MGLVSWLGLVHKQKNKAIDIGTLFEFSIKDIKIIFILLHLIFCLYKSVALKP